jgi:hypothetical protein
MRPRAGTVIVEAAKSPRSFGAPSSRFIQHQGGPSPLAGKFKGGHCISNRPAFIAGRFVRRAAF